MATVTIPVFAKVRIGHFAEAQILESLGVDMIDESEGRLHLVMVRNAVCHSKSKLCNVVSYHFLTKKISWVYVILVSNKLE